MTNYTDDEAVQMQKDILQHLAESQTMKHLFGYFETVDGLAQASQELEGEETTLDMPTLLMQGMLTHMVNLFMRVHEDDVTKVHDALVEMLNSAPAEALKACAAINEEGAGNA